MDPDRWTAETRDLLVRKLDEFSHHAPAMLEPIAFDLLADELLAVLADAGLLLPAGGETREEHGAPFPTSRIADATHVRTVYIGPWQTTGDGE